MTNIHFDDELLELKKKLLFMADTAQEMISLAVQSLAERRDDLAKNALELEPRVNHMEVEIEEEVLRLLALRQPTARDLRLLVAVLKINNDLERIADQACNISGTVSYLLQEAPLATPLADIPGMAKLTQKMVRDSIHAFVHHDPGLAMAVCERDDEADWMNNNTFRALLTRMIADPKTISRCVDTILVSRSLERISDHATNISEEVIFIEEGKNIKHHLQEGTAS